MKIEWDTLSIDIADQLHEKLMQCIASEDKDVAVDLSNVNKIDLSSIQLFLSLQKSLEKEGKKLQLQECTNSVVDAIALCGCQGLLGCEDE